MKVIKFILPKRLYDGDVFMKKLKLSRCECWRGINKRICVGGLKEYIKINNNAVLKFSIESLLIASTILNDLPERYYNLQNIESYFDITCAEKVPFRANKGVEYIFSLNIFIKGKKYIKFKKSPIIFIYIINNQEVDMIKFSRLKEKAKEKKFKIGLEAYYVLENLIDEIINIAIHNAKKAKSIKLMKEHFDNISINFKNKEDKCGKEK